VSEAKQQRKQQRKRKKAMMTRPLNAQTQIATIPTPNLHRRLITALVMFSSLALLTAASACAQSATPAAAAAPLVAAVSPAAFAQIAASTPPQLPIGTSADQESSSSIADRNNLPEAPRAGQVAPIYTKDVPAGMTAQPINVQDKIVIGLRNLYSPLNFSAMIVSAGYEQVTNSEPNYGTDRGAFGQRLGAAAIRETSEDIFTDALFAPLLHEDPRYYVEGPQYGFIHRTLYAVTRPLITRTDSGRSSVNGALLLGYAASSGLTEAYYPQSNRNFHDTASTYGGSIGGAALGFFVNEFSSDVLQALHLAKRQ
jgi:hypothetical protein